MPEPVRAALGLIEVMTLRPDELTAADVDAVRAAGVSDDGIEQAIAVCALFNMIDRLADAFGFHVPDQAGLDRGAQVLLKTGYKLPAPLLWLSRN